MERRSFLRNTLLAGPFGLAGISPLALRTHRIGPTTVVNAGRGGDNTVDLLARLEADCLRHRPDLTILMVGTNDMNSRKYVPLPDYAGNLDAIVSAIAGTGSAVLLLTILPVYEPYLFTRHPRDFYAPEGHAARKEQVNHAIREVAAKREQYLLDMHHIFARVGQIGTTAESLIRNEANSGQTDGIHPTAAGYRMMATALYAYIVGRNLPRSRVVCFGDSITAGSGGTAGNSYPAYLKDLLNA